MKTRKQFLYGTLALLLMAGVFTLGYSVRKLEAPLLSKNSTCPTEKAEHPVLSPQPVVHDKTQMSSGAHSETIPAVRKEEDLKKPQVQQSVQPQEHVSHTTSTPKPINELIKPRSMEKPSTGNVAQGTPVEKAEPVLPPPNSTPTKPAWPPPPEDCKADPATRGIYAVVYQRNDEAALRAAWLNCVRWRARNVK